MSDAISKHILAKRHSLDLPRYASIEFPLNVVNDHKAIALIGGKERIKESLVEKKVQLQLRLRPEDPYQHPIHSEVSTSENLLIKIRLPKGELAKHGDNIARAIGANKDHVHYEPVAIIDKNFRFREMADFQINTFDNTLAQQTTDAFFGNDFEKLKNFKELLSQKDKYDVERPLQLPPFSTFSRIKMPFSYNFTNNKGTAVKSEDGSVRLVNSNQPFKVNTTFVPWDAPAPASPSIELQKYYTQAKSIVDQQISEGKISLKDIQKTYNFHLLECVKFLGDLFEQKPIWLRKHLYIMTPTLWRNVFRYALAYVAYSTRTGPWKQSYIKFGVDPKVSSKYALYQTERFRVHTAVKHNDEDDETDMTPEAGGPVTTESSSDMGSMKELPRDYIFDGTNAPKISTFQLADIKDPQLTSLLTEVAIVAVPTERDGWFRPVNLVQLRAVMKYKLSRIVLKEPIVQSRLEQMREMAINRFHAQIEQAKQRTYESSDEGSDDVAGDEDEEDDDEGNIRAEADTADHGSTFEGDLLSRFQKLDPKSLKELKGLLRQEDLMNVDLK